MPDLSGQESVRSGSPALAWKRQLAISSALLACVLVFGWRWVPPRALATSPARIARARNA